MYSLIDGDGDGNVSYEEFEVFYNMLVNYTIGNTVEVSMKFAPEFQNSI